MARRVKDMLCAIDGCGRQARSHCNGVLVCAMHYLRWFNNKNFDLQGRSARRDYTCAHCEVHFKRHYNLSTSRQKRRQYCSDACRASAIRERADRNTSNRFWSKVDIQGQDDCWEWKGMRGRHGYGRFTYNRSETQMAHRIAYWLYTGEHPGKLFVCHSCDNPPCCNPAHLWLGTVQDNVNDMMQKGRDRRAAPKKGEEHPKSKLTAQQAIEAFRSKETARTIGHRYGVTPQAIVNIRRGLSWAHVTGARNG